MDSVYKQLSGEDFRIIVEGLGKKMGKIGDGAIIPPLNIQEESVKLELFY